MAYTITDLTTIERAIASGQSRVRLADGSELQYQSTESLMRVRSDIVQSLADASTEPTVRRIRIYTSKDF